MSVAVSGARVIEREGKYITALPVSVQLMTRLSPAERLRSISEGGLGLSMQRVRRTGWRIYVSPAPERLGILLGVASPRPNGDLQLGLLVARDLDELVDLIDVPAQAAAE